MKFFSTSSAPPDPTPSKSPSSTAASASVKKPRKHAASSSPPSSGYYATQQNAQRKRAKRQVAGKLVTGFLGSSQGGGGMLSAAAATSAQPKITPSGKKSTAQPRPQVTVPPRGIGPVMEPNDHDVLCGRGGRINAHIGNVRFREFVVSRKEVYLSPVTKKLEKAHIAAQIVQEIRDRGGRFLKEDPDGSWYDIGDAKAIKKVGQALREDAPEIRPNDGSSTSEPFPAAPISSSSGSVAPPTSSSDGNHRGITAKATIPLPRQAVTQGTGVAQSSTGYTMNSANNVVSSSSDPMAYYIQSSSGAERSGNMGPPTPVQGGRPGAGGGGGGFSNPFGRRDNAAMSGVAAALMEQDDQPPRDGYDNPPAELAFGRTFHVAEQNETSVISGLTNTMVSGMSGMSDDARLSSLSAAAADRLRHQFEQQQARASTARHAQMHQGFEAMRANQLQQLRLKWAATNSNRTLPSSDLVAQAAMPAMHQANSSTVARSNSWQDGLSVDLMSWADHSLAGGGIQEIGSVASARSFASTQMRNDTDSLLEQLMQTSLAGRSQRSQRSYAQHLFTRTGATATHPQATQPIGDGASVTSMSLASGGLASLGSVRSIMSDLSENLVALDLAEPRVRMDGF